MKEHIKQFILPKGVFYQFVDRNALRIKCQSITYLLDAQARFLFFSLHKIKMSKPRWLFIL